MMADNRTMAELLQAPTEGYEDAIVVPEIAAANFEIKHGLLTLVQNKQFSGHNKRPHMPTSKVVLFGQKAAGLTQASSRVVKFAIRSKAIVAKVSTITSNLRSISDVAELKAIVRALLLDIKTSPRSSSRSMNECLALADLGAASTNASLHLERLIGTFFFPADFVVVDYVADPRVPLILGRPFLRTARALIDVHGEQMTLRHDDQSVTFKVGDTKTFSYNIIESVNRVDVIDIACEEYVQEVLEISESGNPTSTSDLMIDSRSPSFTPFGGSDFLMEEIDEFLEHDDSNQPNVDGIYDSEGE
ncbi:reverse transcriptase domain-containing protein [Tanacetum coccineum]